jgi:flavin reductase (DIM6/NTAB) family NADH-FMN oxidoreductase RutF
MQAEAHADLRSLMRRVASTVAVITARGEDGDAGITATSVASVSLDPPSILVCVNKATRLHAAVLHSRRFRVNYLSQSQEIVAHAFGGPHDGDRFECGEWERNLPFGPKLFSALGDVPCTLSQATECGTHTVFIGTVQTAAMQAGAPLLYCNGEYASLTGRAPRA